MYPPVMLDSFQCEYAVAYAAVYRLHQGYHFSLPCLLFPHLYLDPSSPLLPTLSIQRAVVQHRRHAARDLPPGGPASRRGGVRGAVCGAVHDKQSRDERKRSSSAGAGELRPLFSEEMFQSFSPSFYVRELLLVPASLRYGKPVVSTGGHCTTTLLSGPTDASLPANGAENVIVFCGCAALMGMRAVQVQKLLNGRRVDGLPMELVQLGEHQGDEPGVRGGRWLEGVTRAMCADEDRPCRVCSHRCGSRISTILRFSAHMWGHFASDRLHIVTGAGVLEGWTHYIWQFVSCSLPGCIR
ncbi:hypothetical protein WOLCODRAFT_156596 [Wolfiporia cocos MD-104 SS10]|uniref:Uncharacterized protein n=1 Tax=Wolfiporia cocos (strain MD-104) TaxID=742152 RepID=A0A2H3JIS3_WOLCO|nr:hypothetical protein WOLCODRAFT_156596 [Wolfiporia cocos MD-104 SS10]